MSAQPGAAACFDVLVAAGADDLARRMRDLVREERNGNSGAATGNPAHPAGTLGRRSTSGAGRHGSGGRKSWGLLEGRASYGEEGCLLDSGRMPVRDWPRQTRYPAGADLGQN